MSRFSFSELEVAVPSWLLELISTLCVGPGIETPLTPARNARVCVPLLPIRVVFDIPGDAGVTDLDVVRAGPDVRASVLAEGDVAASVSPLQRVDANRDVRAVRLCLTSAPLPRATFLFPVELTDSA